MKKTIFTIISAFWLLIPSVVFGQINVKDSVRRILQADTFDAETRFRNAYNTIFYHSQPEEAEAIGNTLVYPFVKKHWSDELDRISHLVHLQLLTSFCYRERGGKDKDEKERLFLEEALKTAEKSGDNAILAECCTAMGYMEIKRGDENRGNEFLYKAIQYYGKAKMHVKVAETLYVISSRFFDIKDAEGMCRVLSQMRDYLKNDKSKQSLYQFNVIQKSYFEMLLEKEKNDKTLVDSIMLYSRKNVELVENHLDELDKNWMHGYAYYYVAKVYNDHFPEKTDSIFHYLDKALEMLDKEIFSRMNESNATMELQIFIFQERAKAFAYQGETAKAFKTMNRSLELLNKLTNYKNLNEKWYFAYQFMADYHEKEGRLDEALKYQKLLQQNEERRYEIEKIKAVNEMAAKYETEKKEAKILSLQHEKELQKIIIFLVSGLAVLLFAGFVLLWRFFRVRKEKMEQEIYEKALLAEMKQNELESIREGLRLSPTSQQIKNLSERIKDSVISADKKEEYSAALSKLDTETLDKAFVAERDKLTNMDIIYILCFVSSMDTGDISLAFNVDPASVRTVRYRIKKKTGKENIIFSMI